MSTGGFGQAEWSPSSGGQWPYRRASNKANDPVTSHWQQYKLLFKTNVKMVEDCLRGCTASEIIFDLKMELLDLDNKCYNTTGV